MKALRILFIVLCILVGLYPLGYFFMPENAGLLSSKPPEVLASQLWNIGFYGHISFGGLALIIGWLQFSKKLRSKQIELHRKIGYVYISSVVISGICSLYIAAKATGGIISILGFTMLGIIWLSSTLLALLAIKKGEIERHTNLMIYSYAACFAAVTLRLWLPTLSIVLGSFLPAYRIVAWLCWVPNIIFAYFLVRRRKQLAV